MYQLFPIDTFMVSYYIYGRHIRAPYDMKMNPVYMIYMMWLGISTYAEKAAP